MPAPTSRHRGRAAQTRPRGWTISAEKVQRGQIFATHVKVATSRRPSSPRAFASFSAASTKAQLAPRAAERARKIFTRLAEAEAKVHQDAHRESSFPRSGRGRFDRRYRRRGHRLRTARHRRICLLAARRGRRPSENRARPAAGARSRHGGTSERRAHVFQRHQRKNW